MLMDEEDAATYLINMEAFTLVEGLPLVMDLAAFNAARPPDLPANATAVQRQARDAAYLQWVAYDQKFCGYVVLSWTHVPMLRERLLGAADVVANPRRGSVLMQAYKDDVYANVNPTIYANRLTRIRAYRQKVDVHLPTALAEINRLHSGLPPAYARTDQDKLLQLRTSLLPRYAEIVKTLSLGNPQLTYNAACEHLVRESVSETLLSLCHVGEREDAHLVAESPAAEALLVEDRGRSRSQDSDRGGGYSHQRQRSRYRGNFKDNHQFKDRSRSHSRDRGRDRSYDRDYSNNRGRSYDRPRSDSRGHSSSYRGRPHSRGRSQDSVRSDRSSSRDSRFNSHSGGHHSGGHRGRSPSPHPNPRVSWADIVCHKCKKKGHKAYQCRGR
jgi:hypothetical protein